MTRTISKHLFALALAVAMLATVSNSSHAALSTADRANAAVAPAPEVATLAAVSTPAAAPTPVAAAAPVAAVATPVAAQPRKTVVQKPKARQIASVRRFGYPCH
jgi:zona occludens toxin (predicted ATPase)